MFPLKADRYSDRASAFLLENGDLVNQAENLGVRFQVLEIEGRLRLMMEIQKKSTTEHLRSSIPIALRLRDNLVEWQGVRDQDALFWMRLAVRRQNGERLRDLAEEINAELGRYLEKQVEWESCRRTGNLSIADRFVAPIDLARMRLQTLRFEETEIESLLFEGYRNVTEGRAAFPIDYPVNWHLLVEKMKPLKYARKKAVRKKSGTRKNPS